MWLALGIGAIGMRYQGSVITHKAQDYGDIVAICDVDEGRRLGRVHPQEATLQEVGPQTLDLVVAEACTPHVRREEEGALEELVLARAHDREARLPVRPMGRTYGRELFQPLHEVVVRSGIVRVPAVAEGLVADGVAASAVAAKTRA